MRRVVRVCTAPAVIAACLLVTIRPGEGQDLTEGRGGDSGTASPRPNAIYLEILGNGGAFSLNYERMVASVVGIRAGVANWSKQDFEKTTVTTVPLTVSYLFNGLSGGLELGGGLTLGTKKEEERPFSGEGWLTTEKHTIVDLTGILGYRWVRPDGWMFRVSFTPFVALSGDYPDSGFFPSAGLTVGRVF